ncbi:MAG: hypothetical protein M3680_20700 [Myxococcota bacterium]|nr:hypothetical protein [Myxococcota bacterium]
MTKRSSDWPAPALEIRRAQKLLAAVTAEGGRVIVAPDRDVDGLGASALAIRAIERLGGVPIACLPGKGEHVHTPAMRERLTAIVADALVVLDMGSRAGPIVEGLPTIVIDHHDATHVPTGVIFVSAAGREPVAPTGLLTYQLLRTLVDLDDLAWLARIATVGDLGDAHPFDAELAAAARFPKTHIRETVSLINAARRAARYRPELALEILLAAREPADIAKARLPAVAELAACRAEVKAEVARVARVAPRVAGNVAVIRFSSGAQIHPLIAQRWTARLAPKIVMVANDGYLPGRVNFALRCAADVDLLAFLRGLGLGAVEGEFANGHPRATGGSVPPPEMDRILHAMGFQDPLPRAAA